MANYTIKYTKESCFEEAKKYIYKVDFIRNAYPYYSASKRNGWMNEMDWFITPPPRNLKWTKEAVFEEAKKYKYRIVFQNESNVAYTKAMKNGWLNEMDWFEKPTPYNKKWTKEAVFEEARKYKSKSEFKKASQAYNVAVLQGWIKEMDWFVRPVVHNKKWTRETCFAEARKYKTKNEFRENNQGAYSAAYRQKWIHEMEWFINEINETTYSDTSHCVYGYFDEINKVCYIGLTCNLQQRHYKHKSNTMHHKPSIVKIYFEGINQDIPQPKLLKDKISPKESQYYENYFITIYKEQGYTILNSGKTFVNTGSLVRYHEKYSKEDLITEAKKYNSKKDFRTNCKDMYIKAVQDGWMKELVWLKEEHETWTYEKCYSIIQKYIKFSEFYKNERKTYYAIKRNHWEELFKDLIQQNKWTYENCVNESKKYYRKIDFQMKSASAYNAAHQKGWLKDFIWLQESKKPNGFWQLKENVLNEAQKYNSKSEFKKMANGAYHSALKNNWIEECNFNNDKTTI